MAAGWERQGLILGLGDGGALSWRAERAGSWSGNGPGAGGGCGNGGIWDLSSSYGSLGLGDGEEL